MISNQILTHMSTTTVHVCVLKFTYFIYVHILNQAIMWCYDQVFLQFSI